MSSSEPATAAAAADIQNSTSISLETTTTTTTTTRTSCCYRLRIRRSCRRPRPNRLMTAAAAAVAATISLWGGSNNGGVLCSAETITLKHASSNNYNIITELLVRGNYIINEHNNKHNNKSKRQPARDSTTNSLSSSLHVWATFDSTESMSKEDSQSVQMTTTSSTKSGNSKALCSKSNDPRQFTSCDENKTFRALHQKGKKKDKAHNKKQSSSRQHRRRRRQEEQNDDQQADDNQNNDDAAQANDDAAQDDQQAQDDGHLDDDVGYAVNDDAYQRYDDDDGANANNGADDANKQSGGADDYYAYQDDAQQNQRMPGDDFFDDRIGDDQFLNDDVGQSTSTVGIDDFYAFPEGPRPPTFLPLTEREVIGYTIASMALILGASGGIGGGGIITPVYILVIGLPLKVAVPCGAVTVLGGSLASTLMNLSRRHPLADRPIIDWDLVLVMEPLILIGTLTGTLFHRLLSEKVLLVLLVLLLSVTAHTTLTKAMRMYQAEKRYIRHMRAAQADPPTGTSPPRSLASVWAGDGSTIGTLSRSRISHGHVEKERILILNPDYVTLRSDLMQQEKFTPKTKIIALLMMFSVLIFLNIMVGGGRYKSPWDIRCGSVAFWTVNVIMIAFLVAFAWAAQTYVVARHEVKQLLRFDYVHGDIVWDNRSAVIYPLVFITAGFFAGTLGIGGGIITVPLMLHFGLHPAVAGASSSAMIFFTSFASTTSFVVFGLLLPDFAIVGFCIGFTAALVGSTIMRQAKQARSATGRRFERNSYIAFVIGGVVLISALLMTIQYVLLIVDEPEQDEGGLCDGLRF